MSAERRGCATCLHDGQCEGLPHCGGAAWEPAYGSCENCGECVALDDVEWEDDDGHVFCSEECFNEWNAENGEDGDEDLQQGGVIYVVKDETKDVGDGK